MINKILKSGDFFTELYNAGFTFEQINLLTPFFEYLCKIEKEIQQLKKQIK